MGMSERRTGGISVGSVGNEVEVTLKLTLDEAQRLVGLLGGTETGMRRVFEELQSALEGSEMSAHVYRLQKLNGHVKIVHW